MPSEHDSLAPASDVVLTLSTILGCLSGRLLSTYCAVFLFDVGQKTKLKDCKTRKRGSTLKQHLANVHGIGVKWHECDHKDCSYKAKRAVI